MSEIFSLMGQSLWGAIFYNSVLETGFFQSRNVWNRRKRIWADSRPCASSRINNVCHKSFFRDRKGKSGVKRIWQRGNPQSKSIWIFFLGFYLETPKIILWEWIFYIFLFVHQSVSRFSLLGFLWKSWSNKPESVPHESKTSSLIPKSHFMII